jgi:hypothetical protein
MSTSRKRRPRKTSDASAAAASAAASAAAAKAAVDAAIEQANAHAARASASSSSSSSSSSSASLWVGEEIGMLNPYAIIPDPVPREPAGSSAKKARRGSGIQAPSMPLLSAVPWAMNQRIPAFARPAMSPAVLEVRILRSHEIDRRWLVRVGWCCLEAKKLFARHTNV